MSGEVWQEVYERLTRLIEGHRTTLVFVNTRRMAERVARELSERLGDGAVTAHHGSMARDQRLSAEQRLKHGKLKVLVATASLELGIDIGDVNLVCQLSSPRAIAAFLQRVGRSGHPVTGTPKGRLFPLSRDDLVECAALLDSVRRGELDRVAIPHQPLDVVAQQIVAEVAAQDWPETALYQMVRGAWPFRDLARSDFDAVVQMLADGFTTRRGRRGALIHRDAVHQMLRARRGARTTALTSGGTIPDTADYQVVLEPDNHIIGSVNEDFAVESMAGDIFQLGNASYRILRVERGTVRVVTCDLTQPSSLSLEVLSARPYAFLDDAPLEERRTQAVMARRWHDPQSASDLGRRLDPKAIARVREEAWPDPVNAEELHDALLWLSCLTEAEAKATPTWCDWLEALARDKRVTRLKRPESTLWIPAERLSQFRAVWPQAQLQPEIAPPPGQEATWAADQALIEILRGRLEGLGPVTQIALAAPFALEEMAIAEG
jgi:ATP-dependent helicase Lhr and Lhr-like helicase